MKSTIKIFSETGCIPHEVLWKYRQGTLSAVEKHEVELHLTDCELCSDALAGMMGMESDAVINELRKSIRNIPAPKKVIPLYNFRVLAAAAVVAVFLVFTYVINSRDKNQNKEIALLTKPEEKSKEESFAVSNSQPADGSEILKKKTEDLSSSEVIAEPDKRTQKKESNTSVPPSDALATEPGKELVAATSGSYKTIAADSEMDNAVTEATVAASRAETINTEFVTEEAQPSAITDAQENKQMASKKPLSSNKNSESSKVVYLHDLKVVRIPAMTSADYLDTVSSGTPSPNETESHAEDAQMVARELPFVYSKTLKDGMGYYKNKKYDFAIQTFDIILERFPNDINATFYKGLSEMESQNHSEASLLFKKVLAHTNKTFSEEAKFKLAVCLVVLRQAPEAKKLFEEIATEGKFYSGRAKEELEKLK